MTQDFNEHTPLKVSLLQHPHSRSESQASTPTNNEKKPYQETGWRWFALLLMNLLLLGNNVCFDSPQPLETQILNDLQIDEQQYSLLYSVWAFPSVITPFIGGYLTDLLGVRKSLLIFGAAITIGQAIVAYGAYATSFYWMLAGRAIYSLGTDPIVIAETVMTSKWFKGKEVALAMGTATTTYGVGRAINSALTPMLYAKTKKLFTPMLFGLALCVLGLLLTFVVIYLDKENDKRLQQKRNTLGAVVEAPKSEKVRLSDVKHFKPISWLIILNFGLLNGYFQSFNAFTNDFYYTTYNFSNEEAGVIISINFIVAAITSAIFGKAIDSYGHRASTIMYTCLGGTLAFAYYLVVPECSRCLSAAIPQLIFGLYTGITDAASFPSLPLVLDEAYLGTGYGLFFVIQNILLLGLPPVAAFLMKITPDNDYHGYFWMLVFFFAWSIAVFFESLMLYLVDKKNGSVLQKVALEEEEQEGGSVIDSKSANVN